MKKGGNSSQFELHTTLCDMKKCPSSKPIPHINTTRMTSSDPALVTNIKPIKEAITGFARLRLCALQRIMTSKRSSINRQPRYHNTLTTLPTLDTAYLKKVSKHVL